MNKNAPAQAKSAALNSNIDHLLRHGKASRTTLMELMLSQYYVYVYHLALALLGNSSTVADVEDDAEDAAQETFIDALACIERYEPGSNLRAWLSKIAVHKCQGILRKRRARQTLHQALTGIYNLFNQHENTSQKVAQCETNDVLWQTVDTLNKKQRIPIILYYVYDYSIAEIAEQLDLPVGTVCSRLHYGVEKLRKKLGNSVDFEHKEGAR